MARPSKTDQELGYLRAAWEEDDDMFREYGVAVAIKLIPTTSRGVWNIRVEIESNAVSDLGEPLGRSVLMVRFPNGKNTTFAGELWNLLHKASTEAGELMDRVKRAQAK